MKVNLKMNNGEKWFSIIARDRSAQGYFPGKTPEEACKNFGLESERCFVESVIWDGKEFIEANQAKQERLF